MHLYLGFWYLFNYFPASLLQWLISSLPLHIYTLFHTYLIRALSTFLQSFFPQVIPFTVVIHKLKIIVALASSLTSSSHLHHGNNSFSPQLLRYLIWIPSFWCPHSLGFSTDVCPCKMKALQCDSAFPSAVLPGLRNLSSVDSAPSFLLLFSSQILSHP